MAALLCVGGIRRRQSSPSATAVGCARVSESVEEEVHWCCCSDRLQSGDGTRHWRTFSRLSLMPSGPSRSFSAGTLAPPGVGVRACTHARAAPCCTAEHHSRERAPRREQSVPTKRRPAGDVSTVARAMDGQARTDTSVEPLLRVSVEEGDRVDHARAVPVRKHQQRHAA